MTADLATASQIAGALGGRKAGSGWAIHCPAPGHGKGRGDKNRSCTVYDGDDGLPHLKCKVSCSDEDVLDAAELKTGLAIKAKGRKRSPEPWQPSDTETPCEWKKAGEWKILDVAGDLVATHIRQDCVREGCKDRPHKNMPWTKGAKPSRMLYRLENLAKFPELVVVICEGEGSADAAAHLKLLSLGTVCGASDIPNSDVLAHLKGRDVKLWPDNDDAGRVHMGRIAVALAGVAASVKTLAWAEAPPKGDAADFLAAGLKREDFDNLPEADSAMPDKGKFSVAFRFGIEETMRELSRFADNDRRNFVTSGIPSLDRRLGGGFRQRYLTVIGAPTGGLKTALVVQMCFEGAKGVMAPGGEYVVPPAGALLVSPEMTLEQLQRRECSRRAGVDLIGTEPIEPRYDSEKARASQARDVARLHVAAQALRKEDPMVRVATMDVRDMAGTRAAIEEMFTTMKDPPLRLVCLDYAQELTGDGDGPRYRQVAKVLDESIRLALKHNIAVVLTSQLNRISKDNDPPAYVFREAQELVNRPANSLHFIVERDEDSREVKEAYFVGLKVRDRVPFVGKKSRLSVTVKPQFFSVSDEKPDVQDLRDWQPGRQNEA